MAEREAPTYDLLEVQYLCRRGFYRSEFTVLGSLAALHLDEDDLISCILSLREENFDRCYISEISGRWNDVYKTEYSGKKLYVKFEIFDGRVRIISFHE